MSDESPAKIEPLHNPSQAAVVQPPLANATNGNPGMGAKALLAKKMAKNQSVSHGSNRWQMLNFYSNPSFTSPTDNLVTPVSQKLNQAKKKHFNKYATSCCPRATANRFSRGQSKPMDSIFAKQAAASDDDEELKPDQPTSSDSNGMAVDDEENPF